MAPEHLADGLVVAIVTAKGLLDMHGGKRRDQRAGARFDKIDRTLTRLETFLFGVDGENGMRGDFRELKGRVDKVEERERQQLEQRAGPFPPYRK